MNDDTINDLKQFIAATVHQEVGGVVDGVEGKLEGKFSEIHLQLEKLDRKIDDKAEEILEAIADTLGSRVEIVEEDVKGLDTRVTKLESKSV